MGLLETMGHSPAVRNGNLFKPNGLGRCGADLFAYDAGNAVGKGQAAAPVDHGQTDPDSGLFFRFQIADSLGRADLPAKCAAVLAITDPRHKHRRPETFPAGLQKCGLKAARNADLHTFPAFNAAFEEFRFLQGTGGTDQGRIGSGDLRKGRNTKKWHSGNSGNQRADNPPLSQIKGRRGFRLEKPEGHGILRTWIITIAAEKTFRLPPAIFGLRRRSQYSLHSLSG